MARTAGTKALPLSDFLDAGLRSRGFRPVQPRVVGIHSWRHPKHRDLTLDLHRGNLPGSTDVAVLIGDRPITRMGEDALLALLDWEISNRDSPNQRRK
jgi:hypothetical protein